MNSAAYKGGLGKMYSIVLGPDLSALAPGFIQCLNG